MTIKNWTDLKIYKKNNSRITAEVEAFLISQLHRDRDKVILEFSYFYNPIIKSFIKKYFWSNVETDDLYSAATEGLILSINNFDPNRGLRFSTYATHYILGNIRKIVDLTNNTIRKPSHINRIIYKINLLDEKYELKDHPLLEEYSSQQLKNAIDAKELKMTNIDEALNIEQHDHYSVFDNVDISSALKKLTPRENVCIVLKFGLFNCKLHTYKELDKVLDCDSELLVKKILVKLKDILNELN